MIPKQHRLNLSEYPDFFRVAKTNNIPGITIRYQTSSDQTRCAVVISKKTAKKAHQRNRLRRQLMNFAYSHLLSEISSPMNIVLIVNKYPQQPEELKKLQQTLLESCRTINSH